MFPNFLTRNTEFSLFDCLVEKDESLQRKENNIDNNLEKNIISAVFTRRIESFVLAQEDILLLLPVVDLLHSLIVVLF